MVLAALPRLLRRGGAGRRLAAMTGAAAVAYGLSRAATPILFVPERHVAYAVPVLALLWVAAAASEFPWLPLGGAEDGADRKRWGGWVALGVLAAGVFGLGGVPKPTLGTVALQGAGLYEYLGTLPEDSFVAGWPNWMSPVPYASGRPVLVSHETHLPYHKGYAEEMRERMRRLTAAYFATNAAPLAELRERYGVTHLVVDGEHFEGRRPVYFKPFDAETMAAMEAGKSVGYEAARQRGRAATYDDGSRFVLDLRRVRE